jgi:hypothetical protein
MPSEHGVGIDMTPRQFMPDRSTIAQSLARYSGQALVKQQISCDLQPCRENLRDLAIGHL